MGNMGAVTAPRGATIHAFPANSLEVTLGRYRNGKAYLAALEREDVQVDSTAREMILNREGFEVNRPGKVPLQIITPASLGFDTGTYRGNLLHKLRTQPYFVCPAEVGPAFFFSEQGIGLQKRSVYVLMNPIKDAHEEDSIFEIWWANTTRGLTGIKGGVAKWFDAEASLLVMKA